MATAAELLSDPELLETEWDLSALVDGQRDEGVRRQLDEADERATSFAAAYAGKIAELDSAAPRRGDARARRDQRARRARGLVLVAAVRDRHRRP